jgi:hypothetical protein
MIWSKLKDVEESRTWNNKCGYFAKQSWNYFVAFIAKSERIIDSDVWTHQIAVDSLLITNGEMYNKVQISFNMDEV